MQTNFSIHQLADPHVRESEKILRTCVHCGFCTATCPTYLLLGDELDSPRGRIYLIKDMLENDKPASADVVRHVDRCLSCLSCMTTCPSGVHYMHLVDHARAPYRQDIQAAGGRSSPARRSGDGSALSRTVPAGPRGGLPGETAAAVAIANSGAGTQAVGHDRPRPRAPSGASCARSRADRRPAPRACRDSRGLRPAGPQTVDQRCRQTPACAKTASRWRRRAAKAAAARWCITWGTRRTRSISRAPTSTPGLRKPIATGSTPS